MTPDTDRVAELVAEVEAGECRLHELDDHTDPDTAAAVRRQVVETAADADCETIGDYGFPAEAADPTAFRCSSRTSYMTGAVVEVDGGASLV